MTERLPRAKEALARVCNAAAAIGRRLMEEFDAVKSAAKDGAAKV